MAGILNKRTVTRADLSDANCVALGGRTTDDANDIRLRITSELNRKFGGTASPQLLSLLDRLSAGAPVGYAYLLADLPFEWAFQRWRRDFSFAGREVEYFGIYQFVSFQEDEARAAGQVLVYDHKGPGDFILELKTRSKSDRLILAKIRPARTLAETIAAVQSRLQHSEPASIQECSHLFIPVIDFELLRDYHELCPPLIIAAQQTRFRLDERGAALESEAGAAAAIVDTNLVFDKPFLVMIQRTGASGPYFALWVANAELLVPWRRH
jgi:hypothetical protein